LKTVLIVIGVIVGVVLIIIATLASTVTSSLNDARDKAQDAADKAMINNFRAQAEIYSFDNNDSYEGSCGELTVPGADCQDGPDTYRAYIELNNGSLYCVDSTGFSETLDQEPSLSSCQ
jgi:competence protein ComGC